MDVGLALILCFLMVSMTAVKSQIPEGPKNALKKVGENVTLKCVTVNRNCDKVDWQKVEGLQSPKLVYRNGQGMLNNDIYPPQRYSVNSTDGCSLTIMQLEINDSGRFICVQAVDSGEETRSSILVVISVRESCLSNVTNNALDKDDGYSFWCTINIPAKSMEPSNVTLSFHNKNESETDTTDEKLTVSTTLTGTAKKENITQRGCRATFAPNTQANYANNTAILDVCTTQKLIVSYPVDNITVSPSGPYYEGATVRCTADGHPPPTFKWTHWKSGKVVNGDTMVIKGDPGNKYTCTATNMFKGKVQSKSASPIEVSPPPPPPEASCGSGCIAGAVCATCICCGVIVGVAYAGWYHCKKKKGEDCPVENIFISVTLPGPDKGITVRCVADGHPPPTFKWIHLKSGTEVDGNTVVIKCDAGDKYTCTATNTVNGKETSQNITIEFTSHHPGDYGAMKIGPLESSDNERQDAEVAGFGPGSVAGAVIGALTGGGMIGAASYAGLKDKRSPRYVWKKKKNAENGEKVDGASEASE